MAASSVEVRARPSMRLESMRERAGSPMAEAISATEKGDFVGAIMI
jgi:hypothetical protein